MRREELRRKYYRLIRVKVQVESEIGFIGNRGSLRHDEITCKAVNERAVTM